MARIETALVFVSPHGLCRFEMLREPAALEQIARVVTQGYQIHSVLVVQYGKDMFREFEAGFVFRPVGQREDLVDDGRTGHHR